jgi:hypothetical protein
MRKEYDFSRGKRGAVVSVPKGKTRITIRLDEDVVAWFKGQVHRAGGGNYFGLGLIEDERLGTDLKRILHGLGRRGSEKGRRRGSKEGKR